MLYEPRVSSSVSGFTFETHLQAQQIIYSVYILKIFSPSTSKCCQICKKAAASRLSKALSMVLKTSPEVKLVTAEQRRETSSRCVREGLRERLKRYLQASPEVSEMRPKADSAACVWRRGERVKERESLNHKTGFIGINIQIQKHHISRRVGPLAHEQ